MIVPRYTFESQKFPVQISDQLHVWQVATLATRMCKLMCCIRCIIVMVVHYSTLSIYSEVSMILFGKILLKW